MRFFSMDGPVFRFLTVVTDLIILNIVYLITCIPIVTIGPATCALYRTMIDKRYGRDAGVGAYFRFFKMNFRQAVPRFLLSAAVGVILGFDIWYTRTGAVAAPHILVPVFIVLLVFLLAVSSWVLALTGQFENTAKGTFKVAALLAIRHFPVSLLLLLRFVPALIAVLSAELFLILSFFIFLIYFALAAYLAAGPMSRIFLTFMPEEEQEKRKDNKED